MYDYISMESNRQTASEYLSAAGFSVFVDTGAGIAMLRQADTDEETPILKSMNLERFSTDQCHLLIVLWETYLENLGYGEENAITRGDLVDRIKSYGVDIDGRKLSAAMNLFMKYRLIEFDKNDKSEDAVIILHPSLQFGWDVPQFKAVVAEYIKDDTDEQNGGAEVDVEDMAGEDKQ